MNKKIDGKKIEEAARKYAFNKYDSTDDEVEDTYTEELQMAFEAGIDWFLDNLWHRYNEVPRNDYSQVVLIGGNNQALPTILDMNDLMDNSEGEGGYECLWKGIVKTHHIKKWFYIEDLLKGGING